MTVFFKDAPVNVKLPDTMGEADKSNAIRLQLAARARTRRPTMDLVVPVYNEADAIPIFVAQLDEFKSTVEAEHVRCIFVNDGSEDATLETLWMLSQSRDDVAVVDLSRNFGKEHALSAGLAKSTADVVVPVDVDLQDPLETIHLFLEKWREGYSVVAGRRVDRKSDSFFKHLTSDVFYRVFNVVSDTAIPRNVGDFRLIDRKVVDALGKLPESTRFMKGLFGWVGFQTAFVDYIRPNRVSGHTSWNYRRLFRFAVDGLMSFSSIPLRIWLYVGIVTAFVSLAAGIRILVRAVFYGVEVPGYASLFVTVSLAFSIQMISLGVLAEYISRIFIESKRRPNYIINTEFGAWNEENSPRNSGFEGIRKT